MDPPLDSGGVQAVELAPEPEVLAQCQLLVQPVVGLHPDPTAECSGPLRGHTLPQDLDGPGVRREQTRQKTDGRGLAGAVRPEKPEDGTPLDMH